MVMSPICTLLACVRFMYVWISIFLADDAVSFSRSVWHVLSVALDWDVCVLLFLVLGVDVAVARSFVLMNSPRAVRGVLCRSTPLCFSLAIVVWLLEADKWSVDGTVWVALIPVRMGEMGSVCG